MGLQPTDMNEFVLLREWTEIYWLASLKKEKEKDRERHVASE
jgi:hypothetical protein